MQKELTVFDSFREAFEKELEENQALSPEDRLAILHAINQRIYGKNIYAGRLQSILEVVEKTRS